MSNSNSRVMPPPRSAGRSQANDSATNLGRVTSPSMVMTSHHISDRDRASTDGDNRSLASSDRSNDETTGHNGSVHGRGNSQFRFTQLPTKSLMCRTSPQSRSTLEALDPSIIKVYSPEDNNARNVNSTTNARSSDEFTSGEDEGMQMQRRTADASRIQIRTPNQRPQLGAMTQNCYLRPNRSLARRIEGIGQSNVNQTPRNVPLSTQGGHRTTSSQAGCPNKNGPAQNNGSSDFKRDLKVVTTSLESCIHFHQKSDYHPALLLFKTYGVLSSSPETPDREVSRRLEHQDLVVFELFERRSDLYLSCYFLETERRLPAVCMGRTYSVVGQFIKEEGIGDFKVLAIAEATPDNGIRQNLFNFNDQLLRKLSLS